MTGVIPVAFWVVGLLLLWLPGALVARLLRLPAHPDPLVTCALQIGIGLAFWPALLLWTTQAGLVWRAEVAQGFALGVMGLGAAALTGLPMQWARGVARGVARLRRQAWELTTFAGVAALTVATRVHQIAEVALPLWVDPVHHLALVRLLVTQGRVPPTFDPFIPDGALTYHWGYHALVAWLAWLLGLHDAFDLADGMLHFGQLLNSLSVLMLYAAGRVLFASRRAGVWGAVAGGLVSWFPAYYLSWGRYTHLAGVLMMAPALILLWRLGQRSRWGAVAAATLVWAGLGLVHVRLAVIAGLLVGLLACLMLLRRQVRRVLRWGAVAVGALLLTLPWWLWLAESAWARSLITVQAEVGAVWNAYNVPNWGLVWAPRNGLLLAVASGGLTARLAPDNADGWVRGVGAIWPLLLLAAAGWAWARPGLRELGTRVGQGWLLLALWCGVTALLLQSHRLGLPFVRLMHVNVLIITLFAPLSLACGGLLAWVGGLFAPRRWVRAVTAAAALAVAIWGATGMTAVVNPGTVLATAADRDALVWMRATLPDEARFVVNTWEWVQGVYAGTDGGYWIPTLADRAAVLPPAQYAGAWPLERVQAENALLAQLSRAEDLDDPALQAALTAREVTHLYLGTRPGMIQAEVMDTKPYAALIYRRAGVSIYALDFSR